ncbi:MAG: cupin domain-containing protein, partial [Deltaproteobacteria bacterium]|nr:cupin domain-containing protein [Deltaproteobacteria bacterium]
KEFEVHPYVQFMTDKYGPYRKWIESEGIPIVSGSYVADVRTLALGEWRRKGGKGTYLSFSDQLVADGYVCEIPPGGSLKPGKQLYEEIVLIASGRGATTIWYDGTPKRTFEWERGSLFAIPLNGWHQHFNASGTEPARYFALTSAPVAFELYRDPEFIFNTSYTFKDRFDPHDEEFFSKPGKYYTEYYGGILHSNFVADIRKINLVPRDARGKGTRNMYVHMAAGSMLAHVSQFPVGRYKKAHRHGPGAHVYTLDSTGYTLMWNEGEMPKRYDWHEGSVISPPAGAWHQHYNTGKEPCKFVALHASTAVQREERGVEQIEFEDEDTAMRKMYEEECAKSGVRADM